MAHSDDMGKRQAEGHETSPKPSGGKEAVAATEWRSKQEREVLEAGASTDEDVGKAGIDRKGIDAPAKSLDDGDTDRRELHAKPLTDNG